jgi:hypothetical protein
MKPASIAALLLWSALAWAEAPNSYRFEGGKVKVTWTTSSLNGKPHLSFTDGEQTLSFVGADIRVVDCDAGKLVSVTIRKTVDSGSTSFTLLVPRVNLKRGAPSPIQTSGVIAIHRFSPVPAMNLGQLDEYNVIELKGEAESVKF